MTAQVAIDSSALVAILKGEPEARSFLHALEGADAVIGLPTVLEVRISCIRQLGTSSEPWLEFWLNSLTTPPRPLDATLEKLASSGYLRFGKGCHPAALNFGDAMTYAVAVQHDAPLLFKGGDFGKTDVRVHPASVVLG